MVKITRRTCGKQLKHVGKKKFSNYKFSLLIFFSSSGAIGKMYYKSFETRSMCWEVITWLRWNAFSVQFSLSCHKAKNILIFSRHSESLSSHESILISLLFHVFVISLVKVSLFQAGWDNQGVICHGRAQESSYHQISSQSAKKIDMRKGKRRKPPCNFTHPPLQRCTTRISNFSSHICPLHLSDFWRPDEFLIIYIEAFSWWENLLLLCRYTKNLSSDKINISTFKGEGELTNLQLDENVLTELLELPSWLRLTSAWCNHITFKISWAKLKSVPIVLSLDEVNISVETCEIARSGTPTAGGGIQALAGNMGKYSFIHKVIDGITITVNTVNVSFKSPAFTSSVQVKILDFQRISTNKNRISQWMKTAKKKVKTVN